MQIDAGRENSERPTRSEADLRPPKWLARIVEALVPPELGSPNELIDVLLETHGSIAHAVLHIPVAIAPPALGRARDAFYWKDGHGADCDSLSPFRGHLVVAHREVSFSRC